MKEFVIQKNDAGQRADRFISKLCPALPKGAMYKYIRKKRIKLNGKRMELSQKLCCGDVVTMYINDEFFITADSPDSFLAAPPHIDIVYEDENIILVNKPAGLVVHEDESGAPDTLINRILHYLYLNGGYSPEKELSFTPSLCNRIDRGTQGIVICAKNAEALRILNEKIRSRELKKEYLCVTVGIPPKDGGELVAYHIKNEKTKTVTVLDKKIPQAKTMVTRYRALAKNEAENLALLNVELVTGRTHQIRAHLSHIGCPLLGDGKYGINRINKAYALKTQALCAYKLTFHFTADGGKLQYLDGKSFRINDVWFLNERFFDVSL